ncbi:MAG: D,D-heptose 1,7-bisphosphate phosphatase [Rhodospirillaceae bacterium]|jgi:D-glycero-D-manno-heptose 1,7-bisphosphate phosphatase|nr:D,D-heptose 1,7-bisphosphate phosphatase [Rhodospirillaceae bacterium]MDP6031754.1 HAD-IIIA family hydrolase [Alphaproteobacteria bacterium]HJO89219.1 HAD-IIIA family hydrolase [Alphaproteobacteria bacterium]|tara:strand:- start:1239 stop:1784 length:546 start_codon:yes stop_codon:yes gene_type:complete
MTGLGGKHRAVFLDRDGVLNRSDVREGRPFAPLCVEEFDILPGVADAVDELKAAGFLVIVTTNQKDIGEGLASHEVLEAMHDKLRAAVPVDDICVCTCGETCRRYKPKPGMLLDTARQWDIDLAASVMVGDRWRDVDAGKAAGCLTYFIDCGYDESLNHAPDHTVSDLPEAVRHILKALSV